jgi:iron complex outermembrane receptor protein
MKHLSNGHSRVVRSPAKDALLPSKVSISAAVFFALHGVPDTASAEQQGDQVGTLQEVVVTASRREQAPETVPYSLSVVSADQLARTGVTDVASLASQVPGLSLYDLGTRFSGATTPIIRGLNASGASNGFRTFEQSPVGTYIGNSPIDGYFELDDIQRIEVLRGPQGTLYGAGALGGALRIIPNSPELGKFAGDIEAGGGTVAHSSGASYTTSAMLNVPIGDTLALRASGKYAYEPGFINIYGLLERTGSSPLSAIPTLAAPTDPVNSSGVITGKENWNDQNTFTGRASLLWKPADTFTAELAILYANVNGDGGPNDNFAFPGGPYPIDPRITFPRGGDYQDFTAVNQPFSRRTTLESMDLSYDAGFATVSATSSYYTTTGSTVLDDTYLTVGTNAVIAGFPQYYAGNPINPRFIAPTQFVDSAHTFTQEVRLVSTAGPDKKLDYVLGLFYENQARGGSWTVSNAGSPERSVAQGCSAPYFIGASFPDCLVVTGPGDLYFHQLDRQQFQDKSEFGEFTWHFLSHGQITFGARHFQQSFTDLQSYTLYTFGVFLPAHGNSAPASKNTFKINPSYQYANNQYVYALWSQGFRRGGANAFPGAGLFKENPLLGSYRPDSVNNYEIGLKGHLASGIHYTFDVFDDEWSNPQISGSLPSGDVGVWNGAKARSRGFEFDLTSPLLVPGLTVTASAAYAEAEFTKNYFYAADTFGNIFGTAGQQLPGSAKDSAAATINYDRNLAATYLLTVSLNDTYRSGMYLSTFPYYGSTSPLHVSGMNIANASASVSHGSWRLGAYVTNVTDKRVVLAPGVLGPPQAYVNYLSTENTINLPREVDVRLGYSF